MVSNHKNRDSDHLTKGEAALELGLSQINTYCWDDLLQPFVPIYWERRTVYSKRRMLLIRKDMDKVLLLKEKHKISSEYIYTMPTGNCRYSINLPHGIKGVYFLYAVNNNELLYIGESVDIKMRFKSHKKFPKFYIKYIEMKQHKFYRRYLETQSIRARKPLLNKVDR